MTGSRVQSPLLAHPAARKWSLKFATSLTVHGAREQDQLLCQRDCTRCL